MIRVFSYSLNHFMRNLECTENFEILVIDNSNQKMEVITLNVPDSAQLTRIILWSNSASFNFVPRTGGSIYSIVPLYRRIYQLPAKTRCNQPFSVVSKRVVPRPCNTP